MSSAQVVGQSAADAMIGDFSETLYSLWFEISVFLATFVVALILNLIKPKETAKKQKGLYDGTPKEAPRSRRQESGSAATEKRRLPSGTSHGGRTGTQAPKSSTYNAPELSKDPALLVIEVCESLRGSQRSMQNALDRYEEMKFSGLFQPLSDLESQLRTRSKYTMQDFYNALVHCATRVGKPQAVNILVEDMRAFGVPRERTFYESAMKMLAGKKCYQEALAVYSHMEQDGVEPSPVTCSCLINFAAEVGELDKAISFFEKLSAVDRPSIRAFMTILRVFAKMQNWQRSLQVLKDMRSLGLDPDTLVCNIVLGTCVQSEQLDHAEALLKEILSKKEKVADVVSFNTVIKGLAQKGEFNRAIGFLEEMTTYGVMPNIITFNTVMDSAVRCNKSGEAWRVLSLMKKAGFSPDKYSCSILVKGLHAGAGATQEQIQNCLELMDSMTGPENRQLLENVLQSLLDASISLGSSKLVKEIIRRRRVAKIVPSASSCNSVFKFLVGIGEFSLCHQIWNELLASNSAQSMISAFGTLVETLVAGGHVPQAFQLLQDVQGRWSSIDSGTSALAAFIRALCKARQPKLAIQAYHAAKAGGGLAPNVLDLGSYGLLVKAECEAGSLAAAVAMLQDARTLGIEPDEAMVSPLLIASFRGAQLELGQKIFEDYLAGGGHPNQVMLCTMIKLYGRCQKLQKALDLVESLKTRYGLEPSSTSYTALFHAYVRNKQPTKALKHFDEISATITPDTAMYNTLISACTQANMVEKGLQLAQEACQNNIDVSSDVLQIFVTSGLGSKPSAVAMKQLCDIAEKFKVTLEVKASKITVNASSFITE